MRRPLAGVYVATAYSVDESLCVFFRQVGEPCNKPGNVRFCAWIAVSNSIFDTQGLYFKPIRVRGRLTALRRQRVGTIGEAFALYTGGRRQLWNRCTYTSKEPLWHSSGKLRCNATVLISAAYAIWQSSNPLCDCRVATVCKLHRDRCRRSTKCATEQAAPI
jgi:hypothetical protein